MILVYWFKKISPSFNIFSVKFPYIWNINEEFTAYQFWWYLRVRIFLALKKLLVTKLRIFCARKNIWCRISLLPSHEKKLFFFCLNFFNFLVFLSTRFFFFFDFWYFKNAFSIVFVKAIWYFVSSHVRKFILFEIW